MPPITPLPTPIITTKHNLFRAISAPNNIQATLIDTMGRIRLIHVNKIERAVVADGGTGRTFNVTATRASTGMDGDPAPVEEVHVVTTID